MAYFSQAQKKAIAPLIKEICKKHGVKASLAVDNYSTVVLNISSGEIDFIANANEVTKNDPFYNPVTHGKLFDTYISVNPYHFENHFTGKAKKFLQEVYKVLMTGNHDNSDVMTDYFDVGWYVDINIGKWDKPYQLTK